MHGADLDVVRPVEPYQVLGRRQTVRTEAVQAEPLDIVRKQLELGQVAYLSLLNAEQAHQQAKIALVQAQATRLMDTAGLFQALGGGWWNRPAGVMAQK